jgi:hypothetical protein
LRAGSLCCRPRSRRLVEHEDWRAACTKFARADGDRIAEIEREMSEYARVINETGDHLGNLLRRWAQKS